MSAFDPKRTLDRRRHSGDWAAWKTNPSRKRYSNYKAQTKTAACGLARLPAAMSGVRT